MIQILSDHDKRDEISRLSDFELGTKNTDYKPISWAKLKARAKKEQAENRSRAMMLEVYAKPAKNGKWLEGLYQEFGLDERAAIRYAKELLQDGTADSVWIQAWYSRPFGFETSYGRQERPISLQLVHLERAD